MRKRLSAVIIMVCIYPAFAAQPFDGKWLLTTNAKSGTCADDAFDVVIDEGHLQTPAGEAIAGSGQVTIDGSITASFRAGPNVISASGRARGSSASGRWESPELNCAGIWSAQRR